DAMLEAGFQQFPMNGAFRAHGQRSRGPLQAHRRKILQLLQAGMQAERIDSHRAQALDITPRSGQYTCRGIPQRIAPQNPRGVSEYHLIDIPVWRFMRAATVEAENCIDRDVNWK